MLKQISKTWNLTFPPLHSWHPGLCLQIYLLPPFPPFPSSDFVGQSSLFSFPPQTYLGDFKIFCTPFFLCALLKELIVSSMPLPCHLEHSKTQGSVEGGKSEVPLFVNRLQRKGIQVGRSPKMCFHGNFLCELGQSKFRHSIIFPKRFH